MISKPHGGRLILRIAKGSRRERLLKEAKLLPKIILNEDKAVDLENIAFGTFSPLEGFMVREEFESTLYYMRLPNDLPWTIPIILDVSKEDLRGIREGDDMTLTDKDGNILGILNIEEVYEYDKKEYALKIFKTVDPRHPGVSKVLGMKERMIGGRVELLNEYKNPYYRYTLRPAETRVLFRELGWKTIAGFQTRNAPHLGHEYVQKTALTFVDGLFINPLVGRKKKGDFKDEVILAAYDVLIKYYYPPKSVVFGILRTEMRYAGPREAIFHAIIRKNFGCTHFIVGRDHAGVGNYYGPYEAQEIFEEFPDLGITPLFFKEFFYCEKCDGISNSKICPHPTRYRIRFSGTVIRDLISKGRKPPAKFMRPEVADVILKFPNPFVE